MGLFFGKTAQKNRQAPAPKPVEPAKEEKKTKPTVMFTEEEEKACLMPKAYDCPICDRKFKNLTVRGSRLRRLDPDMDLRPRYNHIDILKYDTVCCPNCGYSALTQYFGEVSVFQMRHIKEEVMANFKKDTETEEKSTYTMFEAMERYRRCLVSANVKNAAASEKAYINLKMAWLFRDVYKSAPESSAEEKVQKRVFKDNYVTHYRRAYDGFTEALSNETPPICGMDSTTIEFILANMAIYFGEVNVGYRLVGSLLQSKNISARMKDMCLQLKDALVEQQKDDKA